jgi:hypothetical protein
VSQSLTCHHNSSTAPFSKDLLLWMTHKGKQLMLDSDAQADDIGAHSAAAQCNCQFNFMDACCMLKI